MRNLWICLAAALVLNGGVTSVLKRPVATKFLLYAGSWTPGKGIYGFRFDASDGSAEPFGAVTEIPNPSALALHPENGLLYVASEVTSGSVSSFSINRKTGALRLINKASTRGEGPCHVVVDRNGWMLLATNCASGSVTSYRIAGDGSVGDNTTLIQHAGLAPHPSQVEITPDNFFLFVPDAGLNKVFSYRFDPARTIFWPNNPASVDLHAGTGPRHLAFRPDEKFAYSVDETSGQVTAYSYNRIAGSLSAMGDISTLPTGFTGSNRAAEIAVDATGKFLYASNRGDDSIVVFAIHAKTGLLTKLQRIASGGRTPRTFRIDPTGRYLLAANQDSANIVIFAIGKKTGMLTATGKSLESPSPVALQFVPAEP